MDRLGRWNHHNQVYLGARVSYTGPRIDPSCGWFEISRTRFPGRAAEFLTDIRGPSRAEKKAFAIPAFIVQRLDIDQRTKHLDQRRYAAGDNRISTRCASM